MAKAQTPISKVTQACYQCSACRCILIKRRAPDKHSETSLKKMVVTCVTFAPHQMMEHSQPPKEQELAVSVWFPY